MERQHFVFVVSAAAAFAALVLFAFYNPLQQSEGEDAGVIKAKKGEQVFVRYSSSVIKMIQNLPNRNTVEVEVSSELQVTNFAGLKGEVRYPDMEITFVQGGEVETINDDHFRSIEYRFYPDTGNKTKYVYENVEYIAKADDSQLVVAVKPLSTAKVGEQYLVRLLLHTGSAVDYAIEDKVIEIIR